MSSATGLYLFSGEKKEKKKKDRREKPARRQFSLLFRKEKKKKKRGKKIPHAKESGLTFPIIRSLSTSSERKKKERRGRSISRETVDNFTLFPLKREKKGEGGRKR